MQLNIFNSAVSTKVFFEDYWQKKPLLIRGDFANEFIQNLITPEDLAGFALEDEIESRLITHFDDQWDLTHGPLEETIFATLPTENWTLLVQSLDYFHEPLHQLIQACDFMPRWRLDDVMVSFATDHGGVGPHLDQYDVFLIQGAGKRRWRVGEKNQSISKHSPHPEISQIEAFAADLDVTVAAGDLLYIPPNTPHWSESIGDSICYSVGFRAPNIEAITQQLLDESAEQLNRLWSDENILTAGNTSGEINAEISAWARDEIHKLTFDKKLKIAVGNEVTQLKYPELLAEVSMCEAQELSELAFVTPFKLNSISRLAYFKEENDLMVFANGHYISANIDSLELVIALNNYQTIALQNF